MFGNCRGGVVALLGAAKAAAVLILVAGGPAHAQDYPNRTIRLVVNSAIGGTVDITARMMATHLSEALKQPVIVDIRQCPVGVTKLPLTKLMVTFKIVIQQGGNIAIPRWGPETTNPNLRLKTGSMLAEFAAILSIQP